MLKWPTAEKLVEVWLSSRLIDSTAWVLPGDVDGLYSVEPLYTALRVWPPPGSPATAQLAVPPASAALHSTVLPSLKSTVPPGTPAAGETGATAALKVIPSPGAEGLGASCVMLVLVSAMAAECTAVSLLARKSLLPW